MTTTNVATLPQITRRTVRYPTDASAAFDALGATSAMDTALLESADIANHRHLQSLAVIEASLRLCCNHQDVRVEALTSTGTAQRQALAQELATFVHDAGSLHAPLIFSFPPAAAQNEKERLLAPSSIEPLRRLQQACNYPEGSGLPLLVGGFAFDYLASFETLPAVTDSANSFPDYYFLCAQIVLEINHQEKTAALVAVAIGEEESHRIATKLDILAAKLAQLPQQPVVNQPTPQPQTVGELSVTTSLSDAAFGKQVQALKTHINHGDVYQIVASRRFGCACPNAFAAYRALRQTNPSPYLFYLRGEQGDGQLFELFGASPESSLKFTAQTRQVELYPIAGTRPRGLNDDGSIHHELDARNELDLRTSSKEIAEHIMLVDLARNDLARISVVGSRKVAALMAVDRYSRVMHLVSRVVARLAPEYDALDAYRATMNMGTLTGAPKLRATELLRQLEGQRRGTYGGAVGYLRGGGDMDTCIVIRSAFVQNGQAIVQAGAGIVRDSEPQAEADETWHKAAAVLAAIAQASHLTLKVKR